MTKKVLVIAKEGNVIFVDFHAFGRPTTKHNGKDWELKDIKHIGDITKGTKLVYQFIPDNLSHPLRPVTIGTVESAYLIEKKVA